VEPRTNTFSRKKTTEKEGNKKKKMNVATFVIVLSILVVFVNADKKNAGPVTCGSVIKLLHKETVRLPGSCDISIHLWVYREITFILIILLGVLEVDNSLLPQIKLKMINVSDFLILSAQSSHFLSLYTVSFFLLLCS
jgi:hypothetical protein